LSDTRTLAAIEGGWRLEQTAFDPQQEAALGSLFALANGAIGVRGGLDECAGENVAILPDAHVAIPITYHESFTGFATRSDIRFAAPSPVCIELLVDGKPFDPGTAAPLEFFRQLDLSSGVLRRTTSWPLGDGRVLHLDISRLVADGAGAHCASRIEARMTGGSCQLTIRFPIDRPALNASDQSDPRLKRAVVLQRDSISDDGLQARFSAGADAEMRKLAMAQTVDLVCGNGNVIARDGLAMVRCELAGEASVRIDRHVAYAIADRCVEDAALLAARHRQTGWDALADRTQSALARYWAATEIAIAGDARLEGAIRFSQFHLFQSASRDDRHSIAAKGLTGEGYEGHYFWDTEVFVLPVLAFTQPELAAHILRYRMGALDQARRNARQMGHRHGALYPWRTIGGDECSAHYPTGAAQYHINADIAYALSMYRAVTGDEALVRDAAEMLFETARIWLEIGHFNSRRGGAFTIHGVTGPDEYTGLVDNDFYTNAMAQRHLEFAADLAGDMARECPELFTQLARRIALSEQEIGQWRAAATAMWLPVDPQLGVHPQDDSFLDKPAFALADLPADRFPLLLHHHPLLLFRHRLCKQGDVIQALSLVGETVPLAIKRRDLVYYTPLTTHDSTLSATAFAILMAETGDDAQALAFHREAALVDLEDRHGNSHHGVHMAAMAGSWSVLAMGWGGLRVVDGQLHLRPRCPAQWQSFRLRLNWRGSRVEISVDSAGASYRLCEGPPLTLFDHGRRISLDKGGLAMPRPQVDAVIFDLDGVLTDTAEAHFQAWKRLCDEEGMPFDRALNAQLKGVDRAASLKLILDAAGVQADEDARSAMMARKNGYYREAIAHYSPADLFPGARECLEACLAAGLRTGLASASRNAQDVIRALGIEGLFDCITDAATIARGKPDPEIFLTTAATLGCDPSRCVGVEDARAGIAAIKSAGMRAIGIGDPSELSEADSVVPTIASLGTERLTGPFTATTIPI